MTTREKPKRLPISSYQWKSRVKQASLSGQERIERVVAQLLAVGEMRQRRGAVSFTKGQWRELLTEFGLPTTDECGCYYVFNGEALLYSYGLYECLDEWVLRAMDEFTDDGLILWTIAQQEDLAFKREEERLRREILNERQ